MNTRALEAGARAILPQLITRDISDEDNLEARRRVAAAVITAYESYLKAEGFVVVRAEPESFASDLFIPVHEPGDDAASTSAFSRAECIAVYRAMIAAAQEPNDASDR